MSEECLICKAPLEYLTTDEEMVCELCHAKTRSKTRCVNGHFVCDDCHTSGMEPIFFSLDWRWILGNVAIALINSTLCWIIRVNAMKHIDASVVAVMMPFSSVVTTVLSIAAGKDTLSMGLIGGTVLGLIAVILSGLGDRKKAEKT